METYHVPNHIDNIGYASFEGCSSLHTFTGKFVSSNGRCLVNDGVLLAVAPAGLKTLEVEEGVKHLKQESLAYVSELEIITLPSTLESIDNMVFHKNESLKEIHFKSKTPPTKENMSFYQVGSSYKIYVPKGCKEAYSSVFGDSVYEE